MIQLFSKAQAAGSSVLNAIHVPKGDKKYGTDLDFNSVTNSIQSIIRIMLDAIGLFAALYFLYGAFMYIMSMGNEAKATKAKVTMFWAVVGLLIAILAQFMVNIVLSSLSTDSSEFNKFIKDQPVSEEAE